MTDGVGPLSTKRIRETLENIIAQRDYSQRIDKFGDDLYDPLIELINTVLEETQKRGEKIELYKKSLKEQVAVRTADLEKTNQQLALDKRGAETSSLSKSVFLANLSHELRTPLNLFIRDILNRPAAGGWLLAAGAIGKSLLNRANSLLADRV